MHWTRWPLPLVLSACFVGRSQVLRELDLDGDGYLPPAAASYGEDPPWDCKEGDATVFPGAPEICDNGIDEDCDDEMDEGCELGPDSDSDTEPRPPEIEILSPESDALLSINGVVLEVAASDDQPISDLDWTVTANGVEPAAETTVLEEVVELKLRMLPEGQVTLVVTATDGDQEYASAVVTIDTYDIDLDNDGYDPGEDAGDEQDCDDTRTHIHPNAQPNCAGQDDNCDGVPDDSNICTHCGTLPVGPHLWGAEEEHRLVCDTTVPTDATLTVEAGVTLSVEGDFAFTNNGQLILNGEPDAPVTFASAGDTGCGSWKGINSAGPITASHWRLMDASSDGDSLSFNATNWAGALVAHSSAFFCGTVRTGIAGATVTESQFILDTPYATALEATAGLTVINSDFTGGADGITGIRCPNPGCFVSIDGNTFTNTDRPLVAEIANFEQVTGNSFFNTGPAIALTGAPITEHVQLNNIGTSYVFGETDQPCSYEGLTVETSGTLKLDGISAYFQPNTGALAVSGGTLIVTGTTATAHPDPECGVPGSWRGFVADSGSTLAIDNSSVGFGVNNVFLNGGGGELTNVLLHDATDVALRCLGGCTNYSLLETLNVTFADNEADTN